MGACQRTLEMSNSHSKFEKFKAIDYYLSMFGNHVFIYLIIFFVFCDVKIPLCARLMMFCLFAGFHESL